MIDAATGDVTGVGVALVPVAVAGEALEMEVELDADALGEVLVAEAPALPHAVRPRMKTSTRIRMLVITAPTTFSYGGVSKLRSMPIEDDAARLRAAAEAKPMKLPVNRRVDETHHAVTQDGLSVWYTIQVSPHSRIQEAIFERSDRMPGDDECQRWLRLLVVGAEAVEAPGLPGSMTRRFEAFERSPEREAPLS